MRLCPHCVYNKTVRNGKVVKAVVLIHCHEHIKPFIKRLQLVAQLKWRVQA